MRSEELFLSEELGVRSEELFFVERASLLLRYKHLLSDSAAKKPSTASRRSRIIKPKSFRRKEGASVAEIHTIGRIDRAIYRQIAADIVTDQVIITERQITHIKERHPGDFERLYPHLAEIVAQPDHILQSRKPNTALILKEISTDNQQLKLVLRLATRADQHGYKNSIITFMKIDRKEWDRLLRNKTILYSRRPI